MHNSIEVIALPAQYLIESPAEDAFEKYIVWNFRVGVVSSDFMQAKKNEHAAI